MNLHWFFHILSLILIAALLAICFKLSIDHLTGLWRRGVYEIWYSLCYKQRAGTPKFWIAFVDVDGLKKLNDTKGQPYGDQALRLFGSLVKQLSKQRRVLWARVGGDEFAAVYLGPAAAAVRHAHAVRQRFEAAAKDLGVTVTIVVGSNQQTSATLIKILKKDRGGNQVYYAELQEEGRAFRACLTSPEGKQIGPWIHGSLN